MIRTNTPLRHVITTVVFAFLVGVFFPSSTVTAAELPNSDGSAYFAGFGDDGEANGKNGQGGGDEDDGDADPDWWQTTSWNQAQMTKNDATRVEVPQTLVVPSILAVGPYAQMINWLLGHIGNTYINLWR